jgi:hypothetical protein
VDHRNYLIVILCPKKDLPTCWYLNVLDPKIAFSPDSEPNRSRSEIGGQRDENCSEVYRSLLRRRWKGNHYRPEWLDVLYVGSCHLFTSVADNELRARCCCLIMNRQPCRVM